MYTPGVWVRVYVVGCPLYTPGVWVRVYIYVVVCPLYTPGVWVRVYMWWFVPCIPQVSRSGSICGGLSPVYPRCLGRGLCGGLSPVPQVYDPVWFEV